MNPKTLVAVHCYAGDAQLVRDFMPQYVHHECPVLVLSPADAPVVIDGVECRSAGKRGYFGQDSLDRQREHLRILLTYPQDWFLLNDADSMCLSPQLPAYLYETTTDTMWSNEVRESRPHRSPYPKIGVHPPYFLSRSGIEKMLAVGPVEAHSITPFIDWMMLALACEAGIAHRSYPDGKSFPAWRHGAIPETKDLGHDYVHENGQSGVDGARRMAGFVRSGTIFVHSVKHPEVRDQLVDAFAHRRVRPVRPPRRSAAVTPGNAAPPADGLSILVAFRDSDGARTRLWDLIRDKFERELPEAEVIVASDDGEDPFHKTLAINRAAREASGDMLAIWDADSWVDVKSTRQAVAIIRSGSRGWCRPYTQKLKLNEEATAHVLELGADWDGTLDHAGFGRPENRTTFWAAPPLVLSREAFDAVGGMDERFRGWSSEDLAFGLALKAIVGRLQAIRGTCLHLNHPRIGRSGRDLWAGQESTAANEALLRPYKNARGRERMQEVLALAKQPA